MSGVADLEHAIAKIKDGSIPPLILVYGDQDYLVKQAYDRLLEAIVPEDLRGFNIEQLDGTRVEVATLLSAWDIMPMMPGPKAVGVIDARFFQSKSNGGELLTRAKESWERQESNPALRHLGRVLALLGWSWNDAQGKSASEFGEALDTDQISDSSQGGPWLERALVQGLASEFPLPSAADESGELLEGLQLSMDRADPGTPSCLVFSTPSADARKKLYKFCQERGLVLEFKAEKKGPQASQTASVFLRNLLNQRQLNMPSGLAQRFISAYGHDLGLLVKELDKLECFAHPRKDLSESDLFAVGSPQPEDSVFELLAALAKRQKGLKESLTLLEALLEREPAQMIFSMLANELRLLHLCRVLIDEGKISSRAAGEYFSYKSSLQPKLCQDLPAGLAAFWKRTHPFASFQALSRARQFQADELRELLRRLLDADLRLKSSGGDPRLELEQLCLQISGVEEELFI
jgi:DNA polymerase III delta subunit